MIRRLGSARAGRVLAGWAAAAGNSLSPHAGAKRGLAGFGRYGVAGAGQMEEDILKIGLIGGEIADRHPGAAHHIEDLADLRLAALIADGKTPGAA